MTPQATKTAPATTAPAKRDADALFQALFDRSQRGDEKAMQEIRKLLAEIPNWEQDYSSPATSARKMLLEATLGKNLLLREAWERRAAAMERELAGVNPSPLERTLCERIASCWLDAHVADMVFAYKLKESLPLAAGDYFQRRQERAHARYLSAVLALARVRRLLAPMVAQVNIAQPGAQQLNIAAPGASTGTPAIPAETPASA